MVCRSGAPTNAKSPGTIGDESSRDCCDMRIRGLLTFRNKPRALSEIVLMMLDVADAQPLILERSGRRTKLQIPTMVDQHGNAAFLNIYRDSLGAIPD